jgi:hypothetical protein
MMTFSIMTLCLISLGITTLSTVTVSIMTLNRATVGTLHYDTQNNHNKHNAIQFNSLIATLSNTFNVLPIAIRVSAVFLNVVAPSVVMRKLGLSGN